MRNHHVARWTVVFVGASVAACGAGTGEIGLVADRGVPNDGVGTVSPGAAGSAPAGLGGAAGGVVPGGTAGAGGAGGQAGAGSIGQGGGGANSGQGGSVGSGGAGAGSGGAGAGGGGAGGTFVPGPWCAVQPILQTKCATCHSNPPLAGVPMALVSYADAVAPARSNPALRVGELALTRMSSTSSPMPPRPASPATTGDIQVVQAWITAGMKEDACSPPGGGSTGAGGAGGTGGSIGGGGSTTTGGGSTGTGGNPFNTPTVCTSNRTMTGEEGATMRPGEACISCHTRSGEEAPRFAIAGTVYPTAHEPNDCVGLTAGGAQVIIIDASGRQIPLAVNSVGSFTYSGTVAFPFQAKVVRNGLERVMTTPQTVGDCNSCHTVTGANGAPGRIMAP